MYICYFIKFSINEITVLLPDLLLNFWQRSSNQYSLFKSAVTLVFLNYLLLRSLLFPTGSPGLFCAPTPIKSAPIPLPSPAAHPPPLSGCPPSALPRPGRADEELTMRAALDPPHPTAYPDPGWEATGSHLVPTKVQ